MGLLVDRSIEFTLGGTAETLMAANPAREYMLMQNTSDTNFYFAFGKTATNDGLSYLLEPGDSYEMSASKDGRIREAVSVLCATTGKTLAASER